MACVGELTSLPLLPQWGRQFRLWERQHERQRILHRRGRKRPQRSNLDAAFCTEAGTKGLENVERDFSLRHRQERIRIQRQQGKSAGTIECLHRRNILTFPPSPATVD